MPTFESYPQGTPCYVQLTTPDPGAATAFYGALFGWTLTDVSSGTDDVYLNATLEGDVVAGISSQMPELAGHPAFWSVFLAVDDVDATVAAVAAAGGKVDADPADVRELGLACDAGKASCSGKSERPMTVVPTSAADKERRRQLLTDVVLPHWFARCGPDCVASWNTYLKPIHDIEGKAP